MRAGASFGEGAVIGRQFGTTDVLVILPISAISQRSIDHFGPAASRPLNLVCLSRARPRSRHPMLGWRVRRPASRARRETVVSSESYGSDCTLARGLNHSMPLAERIDDQLRSFLKASRFAHEGAVI